METDKKSRVVKGGLEFIPLREREKESDYQIPKGKRYPGQLSLLEGLDAGFAGGSRRREGR